MTHLRERTRERPPTGRWFDIDVDRGERVRDACVRRMRLIVRSLKGGVSASAIEVTTRSGDPALAATVPRVGTACLGHRRIPTSVVRT
jgi:hypothetical protein